MNSKVKKNLLIVLLLIVLLSNYKTKNFINTNFQKMANKLLLIDNVKLQSIKINEGEQNLKIGDQKWLSISATPSNATNKNITWYSTNSNAVEVINGKLIAKNAGTSYVTATSVENGQIRSTIKVVVNNYIKVSSIKINEGNQVLSIGQQKWLSVATTPTNAKWKSVTWYSTNSNAVEVVNGKLIAKNAGTSYVTATSVENSQIRSTIKVVVNSYIKVSSIKINEGNQVLSIGQQKWLSVATTPTNAKWKSVTWYSTNSNVVEVVNGKLIAKNAGTSYVTATSKDNTNAKSTIKVVVKNNNVSLQSIKINEGEQKLKIGDQKWLSISATPSNAINKNVTWYSTNSNAVQVVNGKLIAKSAGTSYVTATSVENNKIRSTIKVVVSNNNNNIKLQSIKINKYESIMVVGTKQDLSVTTTPSNATNKNVVWQLSNPKLAEIKNNTLYAKASGTLFLTAISAENKNIKDTVSIEIDLSRVRKVDVKSIKIDKKDLVLEENEEYKLPLVIEPFNATNQGVIWSTSDKNIVDVNNGKITCKKAGKATITVVSKENKNIKDSIIITVKKAEQTKVVTELEVNTNVDTTKIKALFNSKRLNNVHPRLLANKSDFDYIRANVDSHEYMKKWKNTVISTANNVLKFDFDNNTRTRIKYVVKEEYTNLVVARRIKDYSQRLAMAYQLTGDKKYVNKLWEMYKRAANFPDWNPNHFLDVSETTYGFALGYDWCYDAFTDSQRKVIEKAILTKGIGASNNEYKNNYGPWWARGINNWNAVCNGGLTAGSLAIIDKYPDEASLQIVRSIKSIPLLLNSLKPDGAWFEGPGYWSYTMQYLAPMSTSLTKCLGTDFNISKTIGVQKNGYFGLYAEGPAGIFNYGDCINYPTYITNDPELLWLANVSNNKNIAAAKLFTNSNGGVIDFMYYDRKTKGSNIKLPLAYKFEGSNVSIFREKWNDKNALYLGVRAGNTNDPHGHMDSGSFVLDWGGLRWAEDLGSESYSLPGYLDIKGVPKKFNYYRARIEGHNTVVINPDKTGGETINATGKILKFNDSSVINDLSKVYSDNVNSFTQGYMLTDNRKSVVIKDKIVLKKNNSSIYWFMHTKVKDYQINGNSIILTQNNKKMKIEFITNAKKSSISFKKTEKFKQSPARVNGEDKNDNYRKVAIEMQGDGTVYLTVKITPLDGGNYSDIKDVKFDL